MAVETMPRLEMTPRHVQVLRDVERFSRIQRYYGMLPEKHAVFYDPLVIRTLMAAGLVEEGTVIARCGSKLKGYRITDAGRDALDNLPDELQVAATAQAPDAAGQALPPGAEDLSRVHLEMLADIYHLSKVRKHCGIAPKAELEEYPKEELNFLYDTSLVLYIKLKSACTQHKKGYILSEAGKRVLRSVGMIS